jgi:2-(1,2-epoxy-1,2-dihydrophenyl)acetyl-CoA isomerase
VVPDDHLEAVAREWAHRLADGPTITIGHIKGQLNSAVEATRDLTFRDEATLLALAMSDDAIEARTAFMERREPRYTGR